MIAGLLAGLAGPMLGAVAFHSGNESGSEPVDVAVDTGTTIVASGSWLVHGIIPLDLEVRAREVTTAAANSMQQDASRAYEGEIVAHGSVCTFGRGCFNDTWHGVLSSAYSDGNAFVVDPSLSFAYFEGWLVGEESGQGCRVRVTWYGGERPDVEPTATAGTDGHAADADGATFIRRRGAANVTAPCWEQAHETTIDPGFGTIERTTDAGVDATQALDQLHRREICDVGLAHC